MAPVKGAQNLPLHVLQPLLTFTFTNPSPYWVSPVPFYIITKLMCALWLVDQLLFIVPVNSSKNCTSELVCTKTVDSVEGAQADWFVKLRISCAIYLQATRKKMVSRLASVTSEELIQNKFLWWILSHCF